MTKREIDYVSAVEEVFAVLNDGWFNEEHGASAITEEVFGKDQTYIPLLLQPGFAGAPLRGQIFGRAAYQTVADSKSAAAKIMTKTEYRAVGMLGVHICCPANNPEQIRCARLLALLVQSTFRKAKGLVQFSDERIMEVGAGRIVAFQINVFVTCKYDTFV